MAVIGIDLGTTNTVAATAEGALSLDDPGGGSILPSVVAYPPSGTVLVGDDARRRRTMDPKNTIFSAKRIIGQPWHSVAMKEFRRRYPFELLQHPDGAVFETRGGMFSPTHVATEVLRGVERLGGTPFAGRSAVITVPSLFKDSQRQATIAAATAAGLENVKIVDEPAATAAAYLAKMPESVSRAAVYDLGGGTFDLAIVDCTTDPFTVLAHGGDLYLGGDDIDQGLARFVSTEVLRTQRWDLQSDPNVFARLLAACETAKIQLSEADEAFIDLLEVDPVAPLMDTTIRLNQSQLASLVAGLTRRTFVLCDEVLSKAGCRASDVDVVFLAGGATHLRVIQEGVEAYFGREVRTDHNPMHVVALGAAQLAHT